MRRALEVAVTGPELPAERHEAAVADPAAGTFAGPDGADIPVGAVVYDPNGVELATGRNERELTGDPTAHAEVLALRRAAAAPRRVAAGGLHPGGDPGAVHDVRGGAGAGPDRHGRLRRLGTEDRRRRVALGRRTRPPAQPPPEVYGGVLAAESAALLRAFFR